MKNNLYIMITFNIYNMGGGQTYTWGKCEYLDSHCWDTAVYCPGGVERVCRFPYLNKYSPGVLPFLSLDPVKLGQKCIDLAIKRMISAYRLNVNQYSQIIVESSNNICSLWGELLAEKIGAKHVIFNCNEWFSPPRTYSQYLDFYDFKFRRKELYGINNNSVLDLFQGEKTIENADEFVFTAYNPLNVVQDVCDPRLNKIKKFDWSIGYFGRSNKGYFDFVMQDIALFAQKYRDKSIQLVIIGDVSGKERFIGNTFENVLNVSIVKMGDMVPVPKAIFNKVDVMIAGAGCAIWSYLQNVFTLIPDSKNYMANGLLGYDTLSTLRAETKEIQSSFSRYLEKVLVDKIYNASVRKKIDFEMSDLKHDKRYEKHFEIIGNGTSKMEYYDFNLSQKQCLLNKAKMLIIYNRKVYNSIRRLRNFLR